MRSIPSAALLAVTLLCSVALLAQQPSSGPSQSKQPPRSEPIPRSQSAPPEVDDEQQTAPPVSSGESSSRETRIDISPPKNDAREHPESGEEVEDVTEMHPYDPHRAAKSIEVGEFYLKRKNYRAAEDRFREALTYKPDDATAIFRLAQTLENEGKLIEARKDYQAYLKILPNGKFSAEARKSLGRMEGTESSAQKMPTPKP